MLNLNNDPKPRSPKGGEKMLKRFLRGLFVIIVALMFATGMGCIDVDHDHDPTDLKRFFGNVDIVLTEGYKRGDKPKLEVFRHDIHQEPLCKNDAHLIAFISDTLIDLGVPHFLLNDIEGLANFLISSFSLIPGGTHRKRKSTALPLSFKQSQMTG